MYNDIYNAAAAADVNLLLVSLWLLLHLLKAPE